MATRPKAKDLTVGRMDPNDKRVIGQQVVARILELIRTGSLRAGDRLPPERELIEIFGISRPSLREALRALSMLGVINSLHGGGAYVSDLDARTLLAPLDFYLSLTKSNFADAFDSRRVIEIEIARRAAAKATAADIHDLRDIIEAHKTVQDDPVGFRILDTRFHEKLSEIAGNAVLQRIAYVLYNLGLDFQNFDRRARNEPGLIAQSTADHIKIAAGITTHIPDRAADAMSEHIRNIEVGTQRVLSALDTPRSPGQAERISRVAAEVLSHRRPIAARHRTRA
jgi:GntR family transcriptional regulator, transcriptional repressor for pyruvate dehydrogenase complex